MAGHRHVASRECHVGVKGRVVGHFALIARDRHLSDEREMVRRVRGYFCVTCLFAFFIKYRVYYYRLSTYIK